MEKIVVASKTVSSVSAGRGRKLTPPLQGAPLEAYLEVRSQTETLARPITSEDAQVQTMRDVSPTKWHLGHTSWFFETFLLEERAGYQRAVPEFRVLFNSYYNTVGPQHPRPRRGFLTRPLLSEVYEYRRRVDAGIIRLTEEALEPEVERLAGLLDIGLNHEEQHQELMLADILHVYASNPLRPAYREGDPTRAAAAEPVLWHSYPEGLVWIGHDGKGFGFDNEHPRHRVFVHPFRLASRLVTNGEFREFIAEGGYKRGELWLSDGWWAVQEQGWESPLYWERRGGTWYGMTLYGMRPIDPNAPVCHVSYYEADAYARWADARLPTEAEWEVAAREVPMEGNFRQTEALVPLGAEASGAEHPRQLFGDLWEWTGSAYSPYPGYRARQDAIGEYNGKFMCNQLVLRGGSFATPPQHIRRSYRNFFPPDARWQFMGIRLAKDP